MSYSVRSREDIFSVIVEVIEKVSKFRGFDNTNREVVYYKVSLAGLGN
jgi:hypothetical protein